MTDAQEQIYGTTDHRDDQGTRERDVYVGGMPQAWDLRCYVLQMASQVWRDELIRCSEIEGLGDRERPAKAFVGRCDARQCGFEGHGNKKLLTPDVKRRAVIQAIKDHSVSERRACSLASLDRSTFQYEKKRGGDEVLRERLRALANERRRFGYRRLGILLAQEGHHANHKKLYRIYAEEKLAVRRRKG